MELDALRFGNFTPLGTAVSDWTAVISKLESLKTDAHDQLDGKSQKANWAGVNATVTRQFITRTAKEFGDAVTEATSIRNILQDTYNELVDWQQKLNEAIEHGLKNNLTVVGTGNGGFTVTMNIHPDRAAKGTTVREHSQADVDNLRDEVQRILAKATESDNSAAQVLTALAGQTPLGFSDASYGDRDAAAKALKDAEDLANLIKKKGDGMTPEEFDNLTRQLGAYKNDPLFQEKFATTLGPRGVLDFWADLSDPSDGGNLQRARHDQLGDLQKNLSFTLAGATQSDSPEMRKWEQDMIGLGDQQIKTRGTQVYGFQLMSNLMRVGDYDDTFLNGYGNALVSTEKKMKLPDHYWNGSVGGPPMPKMNFMGDEFGRDPMTGFMTALAKSPDAATEFFNSTVPQDNAEYVLKDRHTFDDTPLNHGDANQSKDATGKALIAAATGVDPNDHNAALVDHTPEHRQVLDRSLKYLAAAGDDFAPEFRDSMAVVLGKHSDETHYSMSALASDPNDPKLLDRGQLLEVTKQISRSQESYGKLNEVLNQEMLQDISNDHPKDPHETLQRAGHTTGFLEEARYQALKTDKHDPSWHAKWLYHGFGAVANLIPFKLGDSAQRGVDALAYQWQLDEQARIEGKIHEQNSQMFAAREHQLMALAKQWDKVNPDSGKDPYTLALEANAAAGNGNNVAKGLAGDQ
ncbi:hypothetical protein ACFVYD_00445 [Streptomyces sp. NPDC058301]|uniref:hypothetical protein n=1 Tax=Streptomyces sp. NPDC058301 TaxID=3346436 RepID=UPI0036E289D4